MFTTGCSCPKSREASVEGSLSCPGLIVIGLIVSKSASAIPPLLGGYETSWPRFWSRDRRRA